MRERLITNPLTSSTTEDHPRVCGKDITITTVLKTRLGSPPRMRERPHKIPPSTVYCGITPAYAGKTPRLLYHRCVPRDHPRVCGKDGTKALGYRQVQGSPPRMRERRLMYAAGGTVHRITPAYAGKTMAVTLRLAHDKDHPRVCGKDLTKSLPLRFIAGSPPRMRERLHGYYIIVVYQGITPAYAGKTEQRLSATDRCRDHPRVCGKDIRSPSSR